MTSAEFEPIIPAGERPQTYALDRAATRTGVDCCYMNINPYHANAENMAGSYQC